MTAEFSVRITSPFPDGHESCVQKWQWNFETMRLRDQDIMRLETVRLRDCETKRLRICSVVSPKVSKSQSFKVSRLFFLAAPLLYIINYTRQMVRQYSYYIIYYIRSNKRQATKCDVPPDHSSHCTRQLAPWQRRSFTDVQTHRETVRLWD